MKWEFFAGLGLGAAIGMLVAPKPGIELRDDIQDFARENLNRERFDDLIEEGRQRIQPLIDDARERIEPVLNETQTRAESIVSEVQDRVEPALNELRETARPFVDRARQSAQSAADSVREQANRVGSSFLEIINDWPHDRLIAIDGIGPVLATKIIQGRPYQSEQQLIQGKELPPSAIESLRKAA